MIADVFGFRSAADTNVPEAWPSPAITADKTPFCPTSRAAMDADRMKLHRLSDRIRAHDLSRWHRSGRGSPGSQPKDRSSRGS